MNSSLLLLGGCSGSGKTTVSKAWIARNAPAAHIATDHILTMLNWSTDAEISEQSAAVNVALVAARTLIADGASCIVEDILDPYDFYALWMPRLDNVAFKVAILNPGVPIAAARAKVRDQTLNFDRIANQAEALSVWPTEIKINNADLSPEVVAEILDSIPNPTLNSPAW